MHRPAVAKVSMIYFHGPCKSLVSIVWGNLHQLWSCACHPKCSSIQSRTNSSRLPWANGHRYLSICPDRRDGRDGSQRVPKTDETEATPDAGSATATCRWGKSLGPSILKALSVPTKQSVRFPVKMSVHLLLLAVDEPKSSFQISKNWLVRTQCGNGPNLADLSSSQTASDHLVFLEPFRLFLY